MDREMVTEKKILDACCGSRMFWFDKENPEVLFADIRQENTILCDGRALNINPDIQMDFRDMPFADNTFRIVVFDPPHMNKLGQNTWMAKKYGVLLPTWRDDIKAGFNECMRVLEPEGILIFKWNEAQINLNTVLAIIEQKPLFGHVTGKHGKTIWMTFIKKPTDMNTSLSKQTHLPGSIKGDNGRNVVHPYLRAEFWANPRNQFWNSSLYSEKSKEYFNKTLTN